MRVGYIQHYMCRVRFTLYIYTVLNISTFILIMNMATTTTRRAVLDNCLCRAFALCMVNPFDRIIHKNCFGCEYNRLSQREHDVCLMLSPEEKVDCFFEIVMEDLEENELIDHFKSECKKENYIGCAEFQEYLNKKWRDDVWKANPDWKHKVRCALLNLYEY